MPLSRELSQLASVITVRDTNRDVGINSAVPTAKLDVGGDVNVSGVVTATAFHGDASSMTGFSLGSDVNINTTGIITAASFVGNGSGLTGVASTDNIQTATSAVFLENVNISGITTLGIVTGATSIQATNFYGNASGLTNVTADATVAISTTPPTSPSAGDMWYSINHARTFIYYSDADGDSQWIDSAPFNQPTSSGSGGASVSIGQTAPTNPSTGDMWYSTVYGRTFIYYVDVDSSQWVDSHPFNVGIVTTADVATTAQGLQGTPDITVRNVNAGIVTATSYHGDGSSLTGITAGATLSAGSGSQRIVLTGLTSGTMTAAATDSDLTYNSSTNKLTTGTVAANNFTSLSDERFKTNIGTVTDALEKVNQLRGVSFDWVESGNPSYGVIAQELEEVLPELIDGENPKTVNYLGIIGVLIEAVKELSDKVERLENKENE